MLRVCCVCGINTEEFYAKECCSQKCYDRQRSVLKPRKKVFEPRTCDECGNSFVPWSSKNRFCSVKCKESFANKLNRVRFVRNCLNCGKEFRGPKKAKYCSISCSLSGSTKNIFRNVVCTDCGQAFVYNGRGGIKRCLECRKLDQRKRTQSYCIKTGKVKNPGVGSGGAQFGEQNHQWLLPEQRKPSTGPPYRNMAIKHFGKYCYVCGVQDGVHIHHIDGDRRNRDFNNLIPLCLKHHWACHRIRKPTCLDRWLLLISLFN